MKKFFILLLFFLSGCASESIKVYSDEDLKTFDELLARSGSNAIKYDLRQEEDCLQERIPGFFCARSGGKSSADIFEELVLIAKKKTPIILIDDGGDEAYLLAEKLKKAGYRNIHYFQGGYERYVALKGKDFVPETGECSSCQAGIE